MSGEVWEFGSIKIPAAEYSFNQARWNLMDHLTLPLREQLVTWRDSKTGVITQFMVRTWAPGRSTAAILNSTKPT